MKYVAMAKLFITLMRMVEENMPESSGKEKFDAVLDIFESIVGAVDAGKLSDFQKLATDTVNTFRALGVFKAKT